MCDAPSLLRAGDALYPAALARLPRPPALLYALGVTSLLEQRLVALVGARAALREGVETAERLAGELAQAGLVVISGGAIGIDAAAHHGCLAAGGGTVVVLGNGLDRPYPARNRPLFRRCLEGGGLLLSPFPTGTPPRRNHFPQRNGIIAALARVVVVVEAGPASGSLQTAAWATRLGVPVAVVPRSPGARALVARGAAAIASAGDVLALLAGRRPAPAIRTLDVADEDQRRLLAVMQGDARAAPLDHWVARVELGAARVAMALLRLELEGWVSLAPGGLYAVVGNANALSRER